MIYVLDRDIELKKFFYHDDGYRRNAVVAIPWYKLVQMFRDHCRQDDYDGKTVQRNVSRSRVKKMADYLEERILKEERYVIPPVMITMLPGREAEDVKPYKYDDPDHVSCIPYNNSTNRKNDEVLKKGTVVVINDGQHRVEAIKLLMKRSREKAGKKSKKPKRPELHQKVMEGYRDAELVAQVHAVFMAEGMQQIFADINANASKPSKSISMFFDKASGLYASIAELIEESDVLRGRTDIQKNVPGGKSPNVFSMATVTAAIRELFPEKTKKDPLTEGEKELALDVFDKHSHLWETSEEMTAERLRAESLAPHAVYIQGLFKFTRGLIEHHPDTWKDVIEQTPARRAVDSTMVNRCVGTDMNLRILAGAENVRLVSARLKQLHKIPLSPDEHEAEHNLKMRMRAIADMEKARKKGIM